MRYRVVEAQSAQALQGKVQDFIDRGWEPLGGLAVGTYAAGAWWYYQALVKSAEGATPIDVEED
jgi:hypothetical protein